MLSAIDAVSEMYKKVLSSFEVFGAMEVVSVTSHVRDIKASNDVVS